MVLGSVSVCAGAHAHARVPERLLAYSVSHSSYPVCHQVYRVSARWRARLRHVIRGTRTVRRSGTESRAAAGVVGVWAGGTCRAVPGAGLRDRARGSQHPRPQWRPRPVRPTAAPGHPHLARRAPSKSRADGAAALPHRSPRLTAGAHAAADRRWCSAGPRTRR